MRGIESIVGAYIALVIIITILTSLYFSITRTWGDINSGLREHIVSYHVIEYPPVLSLVYLNETRFKLEITPYTPIEVTRVVVRDLYGNPLYYTTVSEVVSAPWGVEVIINTTPVVIYIESKDGITYYYLPSRDPRLLSAPDYIRNKPFVDEELLAYLKSLSTWQREPTGWIALRNVGYKVLIARTTKPSDVLEKGPILCVIESNAYAACNVNTTRLNLGYWYYSLLTYNYTDVYWWITSDGFLNINASLVANIAEPGAGFFQVLKLLKARGSTITMNFTVDVNITTTVSYRDLSMRIIAYILPGHVNIHNPIILAPPGLGTEVWLQRVTISQHDISDFNYTTLGGARYSLLFSKNISTTIELSNLGYTDYLLAVGVELVCTPYSQDLIKIKIDI